MRYLEDEEYEEAANWFIKSAEQGNIDAQYAMGILCESGYGVPKDLNEARYWYLQAAKQGDADAKQALRELSDLEE